MISNNLLIVIATIGTTFGIVGTVVGAIPCLTRNGVNVQGTLKNMDKGITVADEVLTVANEILPNNSIINGLKIVDKYAHIGVNEAEQLYLTSQLRADQRLAKAKETIQAALNAGNITITPQIEKIINGAIEAEVLALGHKTHTEDGKVDLLCKNTR